MSKAKLGTGRRFRGLEDELAHRSGVKNPRALAAYIGDRKYGPKKMGRMAARNRGK